MGGYSKENRIFIFDNDSKIQAWTSNEMRVSISSYWLLGGNWSSGDDWCFGAIRKKFYPRTLQSRAPFYSLFYFILRHHTTTPLESRIYKGNREEASRRIESVLSVLLV
jgi:hypothetical protein